MRFAAGDDGLDGASSGHWLKSKAFRKIRCSRKVPLSIEWISSMMSHALLPGKHPHALTQVPNAQLDGQHRLHVQNQQLLVEIALVKGSAASAGPPPATGWCRAVDRSGCRARARSAARCGFSHAGRPEHSIAGHAIAWRVSQRLTQTHEHLFRPRVPDPALSWPDRVHALGGGQKRTVAGELEQRPGLAR
jgi:hypothetical protein